MATEIDNLQININAQSEQAGVAIDKLVAQIDRLTAALGRVGAKNFNTTSTNMVVGLNRTSSSASKAKKSFGGLASAIGKFYATYFMVVRGIKAFGRAIEGTADYLEAFNYFDVALNKIGKDWAFQWEKYGYDSAEEYASSFSKRLTEKLSGMSGLKLDISADGKTGLLTDSAMKNLGLNIQEVTQYASQLASVTNSIGQTGEVSLAAASAFTKLGADMSSLFNMKYSDAMKNLQSGLIGQSRALYKYGIDITNATLQTYAYKLGVEKAVSEMTQAEKMQLRMIAILDQSKVSWGDLANTINSPSNMLRQFTNNVKEAGMVLGQIFIPLLEKIMPVINGVTIAIKRLLVNFATMMGIKLDLSSFGQGTSGVADEIDGISDSLDDVSKSAKKAKAGLRAFDELNIIQTPSESSGSSSGGGSSIDLTKDILKATDEYEKAWNEAFAKMENKAQAFADKVDKVLEPIKKIFQGFVDGDFFNVGQDISSFVVGINNYLARAIDSVDWYGIGKKIGKIIAGIDWIKVFKSAGNVMWQGLKAAFEMYVGIFSTAPLETALVSLAAMPKLLKAITATRLVTGVKNLWKNFGTWGNNIKIATKALTGNKESTALLISSYPKLGKAIEVARQAFDNFRFGIENGNWMTGFNEGITVIKNNLSGAIASVRNNLSGLQKGVITAVAGFVEFKIVSNTFEGLVNGSENIVAGLAKIGAAAGVAAAAMYTALEPAGLAIAGITGVIAAVIGIEKAFKEVEESEEIAKYGDTIQNITDKISERVETIKKEAEETQKYVNTSGAAEIRMAEDLAEKYYNLAGKENLSNEEKEQMKIWAQELCEIFPDLNSYVDKETGLLTTQKGTIEALISKSKEYYRLQAAKDKIIEAYEKQIDAEEQLAKTAEMLAEAEGKAAEATAAYNNEKNQFVLNKYKLAEAREEMEKWNERVKELTELQTEAQSALDETNESIDFLNDVIFESSTAIDKVDYANLLIKAANAIDELHGIWGRDGKQILGQDAISIQQEIEAGLTPDENGWYRLANGAMVRYGDGIKDGISDVQSTLSKKDILGLEKALGNSYKIAYSGGKIVVQEAQSGANNQGPVHVGVVTTSGETLFEGIRKGIVGKTLSIAARLEVSSITTKGGGMRLETKAGGGLFFGGRWHPVTAYAGGGTPVTGQMFLARERGPELVGTIGSHTAVVNNDQIVASVSDGVARAVASVFSSTNQNGATNRLLQELIYAVREERAIEWNGREIGRQLQKENDNYIRRTGHSLFEY